MNKLNRIFWLVFLVAGFSSCKKDDDTLDLPLPEGLGGDTWVKGPIDNWLNDSLTTPYNISVKYRWDPWELQLDRTLTPPDESRILDAMSAIKRVWIDPYNEETGSDLFMKQYSPKQFVLVGSVQYDFGTVILGQAEGGNNIVFLDINQNFDKNSVTSIKRLIHTSHHEFAHILHQTVLYPEAFKTITADLGLDGYTSTWFNISEEEALANGYITPYSMATYDEDFVEMIANMLLEGRSRFDELVASTNATAQQALRAKERMVVDYFEQVWNMDFYSLQTRVQTALNKLVPPSAVTEAYGFDKEYTIANIDPANQTLLPQSATFTTAYNNSANAVAAIPDFGLQLDSMELTSVDATTAVLTMFIKQGATVFSANFQFQVSGSGNQYTYTYAGVLDANAQVIETAVAPLLNYFSAEPFVVSWYADPSVSIYPRIRFAPQSNSARYFVARLLP